MPPGQDKKQMFQTIAWGFIQSNGNPVTLESIRGATVQRVGVGIYNIFLSPEFQLDDAESMVTITPYIVLGGATVARSPIVESLDDTRKRVIIFDAAGATVDQHFYFKIERLNIL
jgi:hypothetical protein